MKIRLITKIGFALSLLSLLFLPHPVVIVLAAAGIVISLIGLFTA
jgi:hypothetical protein